MNLSNHDLFKLLHPTVRWIAFYGLRQYGRAHLFLLHSDRSECKRRTLSTYKLKKKTMTADNVWGWGIVPCEACARSAAQLGIRNPDSPGKPLWLP